MLKYGFAAVGLALLALVGVVLFNTFPYGAAITTEAVALPKVPDIDANRAAARLGTAIGFRTVTLKPGDPAAGQEQPWLDLHAFLQATYPAFHGQAKREIIPGGYSLLYTWGGSDAALKPLLLMAHQDVVPVNAGTEGDWDAPPFSGEIKNGYIYGRGAIDDKSAMIAQFEALEALAQSGFKPRRTLIFMLGHDEEVSGSGAQAGIALLKSRGITPEMALDEGFMAIDPSPLTGKAMGLIGIAEKGYITLDIIATAEGGHSSTPPRNSGAVRLAKALIALETQQMPADFKRPPVSSLFSAVAKDLPFLQRMAFANPWLFGGLIDKSMSKLPSANAMIRTTTAPTMLQGSAKENVLPQRARATVNFRIHPNDTAASVLAHVKAVTKGIEGLEVVPGGQGIRPSDASPLSPTDNRPYGVIAAVARDIVNGAPVVPGLVLGATDARYADDITKNVYRFMPALLSPKELTGFHGTNERLSVENIGRMSKGYAQIILAMDAAS